MLERYIPLPARQPRHRPLLGLLAASLTGAACTANIVTIGNLRGIPVGPANGSQAAIEVALQDPATMHTQARMPKTLGGVTFYEVQLIQDQGALAGVDYTDGTMSIGGKILSTVYLDGPAAGTPGGALTDSLTAGRFAFTNVPAGTYRVRVKAKADANTPGTTVISNPDTFFGSNSGWEISENTAIVSNGSSVVGYSAPDLTKLTIDVNLQQGLGDTVITAVTVANGRPDSDAGMAPFDAGSATVMHDLTVNAGGVNSTFVWIPRFTAYQLVNPTSCGSTMRGGTPDSSRMAGYWVATVPSTGTNGTDYVQADFGGFYVGKYEASRSDTSGSTPGISTTLSVRPGQAPWAGITWEEAARTCREYMPNSSLIGDDEWTAIAVHSMINLVTVKGNNNGALGDTTGGVTYSDDTSDSTNNRALTGTGGTATAHDGTAAGVYDLNGNVGEWTANLSSPDPNDFWFVDGINSGVAQPNGLIYVEGLQTNPVLRLFGVPTGSGTARTDFGNDTATMASSSSGTSRKVYRGGKWTDGAGAGLWGFNAGEARTTSYPYIGFRPVLRF
jgi:hypothetical protein